MGVIEERRALLGRHWSHVFNRGVAKRPILDSIEDARSFRACLARVARDSEVEVHAWVLMATHFHLLLRSEQGGGTSAFMHRVQSVFGRVFNERTGRSGPLMKGRFCAVRIEDLDHLVTAIRYIDANPVAAGMVETPYDYVHGSASAYVHRHGPPWLTRGTLEALACERTAASEFCGETYREAFPPLGKAGFAIVDQAVFRQREQRRGAFLRALPDSVQRSFEGAQTNADGDLRCLPDRSPACADAIEEEWAQARAAQAGTMTFPFPSRPDPWQDLLVGVLYIAGGLTTPAIALRLDTSQPSVSRALRRHARRTTVPSYDALQRSIVTAARAASTK